LINAKYGTGVYQLDREHLALYPEFEDNEVVMDEAHPTSVEGQEKIGEDKTALAAKNAAQSSAAPKTKGEEILEAVQRIEQRLASIVQTQESLERIFDEKIHALDVKLTAVQTTVDKLDADIEQAKKDKAAAAAEDSEESDDLAHVVAQHKTTVP
jgi:septal ring factor EnvC (AmiA/AmiB activator)